jgi:hypothetical protein
MGLVLAWIGAFLSLTALGWAVLGGIRLYRAVVARRSPESARGLPIERLGANLCRLRTKLEAAENDTSAPYKAARVRALRGAYLDTLSSACEELQISPPAADRGIAVPLTEIYRAEAALRECGLDVRRQVST